MRNCVGVKANLLLHCGASKVSRAQVFETITPNPTETWQPIAHGRLLHQVERAIGGGNLQVVEEAFALSADHARFFGLLQVSRVEEDSSEYAFVVGLRNSHDRRFTASLAVGAQVFCCDNLSFSGEIVVARKHTTFIERDLPSVAARAIGQLSAQWGNQDQRFAAYKATGIKDATAHDLIVRLLDVQAIRTTQIPYILKEWRHPRHEEFADRNAWSFFNAITQANIDTGAGIWKTPARTQALHAILDQEAGVLALN